MPIIPSTGTGGGGGPAPPVPGPGLGLIHVARVISTANLVALSGLLTIDGVLLAAGDRVLVAGQTTASENGIYVVAVGAWTRAADFDAPNEIVTGTLVSVIQGTLFRRTVWMLTTTGVIIVGATALTFEFVNGQFTAYLFAQDTDTGWVSGGADAIQGNVGGAQKVIINANGLRLVNGNLLLSAAAGVNYSGVTGNITLAPNSGSGQAQVGRDGALATNATFGFATIPSCPGPPTGVPVNVSAGHVPLVVDTVSVRLYGYFGGLWNNLTGA